MADNKGLPKVGKVEGKMTTKWGTGTMVIPAPIEVDEIMRTVPKGKITTIHEIRAPSVPKGLSESEWRQYRAGRDAAIAEFATELGINVAVVEL